VFGVIRVILELDLSVRGGALYAETIIAHATINYWWMLYVHMMALNFVGLSPN
jgi:hypothetical protein